MKLLIISDVHFGARAENLSVDSFFRQMFTNWFFPLVDREKPDAIFDAGDLFDRRKFVNYQILHNCREYYFRPIAQRQIPYHVALGNHDIFFKNTNEVNALTLVLADYPNIKIYQEAVELDVGSRRILMFPWVPLGHEWAARAWLRDTTADVLIGHLDASGVNLGHGAAVAGAFAPEEFDHFNLVLSGHVHTRHKHRNIQYLGNPCDTVWPDWNVAKGVHTLDTETLELKFHANPYKLHHKIIYSDRRSLPLVEPLGGKFVQIVVEHKDDPALYTKWLDELEAVCPASISVNEMRPVAVTAYGDLAENEAGEDMRTVLKRAAETVPPAKRDEVASTLLWLYEKAGSID